jgi:hypothetical protein
MHATSVHAAELGSPHVEGAVAGAVFTAQFRHGTGGRARALADLIVLRIGLAVAVVQAADHHRPVDIPFQEIHQHFLADARHGIAAPVGASDRRDDADPGAGRVVARRAGMTVGRRMIQPAVAGRAALPVKLHFDAVIAVGVDYRAGRADHYRGLLSRDGWPWMQHIAVAIQAAAALRGTVQ